MIRCDSSKRHVRPALERTIWDWRDADDSKGSPQAQLTEALDAMLQQR